MDVAPHNFFAHLTHSASQSRAGQGSTLAVPLERRGTEEVGGTLLQGECREFLIQRRWRREEHGIMMTAETNSGRNTPGLRSLTASEDILLTRALGAWSEDELKYVRMSAFAACCLVVVSVIGTPW